MVGNLPESSPMLDAVRALAPEIEARAEEIEQRRAVPPDLIQKLRELGLFRFVVPKSYGGLELNQLQASRVIEELAKADGSVGWTAFVAFGFIGAVGLFPRHVLDELYANGPDLLVRGAAAPQGTAERENGGFRLSGRWAFASGPFKPNWLVATGTVTEDGKPVSGPDGLPMTRSAILPGDRAEWLDTWYTLGLRGTDSTDFTLKDVLVDEDHTVNLFDLTRSSSYETPLLKLPFRILAAAPHTPVALGIAQGAVDELAKVSRTKRGAFTPNMVLADDPVFRHKLGELAARASAIRAVTDMQCLQNWDLAQAGETPSPLYQLRYCAQVAHCHLEAAEIVNQCFALSGSYGLYSKSSLQRRWRDMRSAAQHAGVSPAFFQMYGAMLAGEPDAQPAARA